MRNKEDAVPRSLRRAASSLRRSVSDGPSLVGASLINNIMEYVPSEDSGLRDSSSAERKSVGDEEPATSPHSFSRGQELARAEA